MPCPTSCLLPFLLKVAKAKPTAIMGKANFVTLNAMSWPVMVVPMLAPITTPTACWRFIRALFTNPTVITVVALELCTSAVTRAPAATPMKRLVVRAFSMVFILLPATF